MEIVLKAQEVALHGLEVVLMRLEVYLLLLRNLFPKVNLLVGILDLRLEVAIFLMLFLIRDD